RESLMIGLFYVFSPIDIQYSTIARHYSLVGSVASVLCIIFFVLLQGYWRKKSYLAAFLLLSFFLLNLSFLAWPLVFVLNALLIGFVFWKKGKRSTPVIYSAFFIVAFYVTYKINASILDSLLTFAPSYATIPETIGGYFRSPTYAFPFPYLSDWFFVTNVFSFVALLICCVLMIRRQGRALFWIGILTVLMLCYLFQVFMMSYHSTYYINSRYLIQYYGIGVMF